MKDNTLIDKQEALKNNLQYLIKTSKVRTEPKNSGLETIQFVIENYSKQVGDKNLIYKLMQSIRLVCRL
jgi:hypothetical protein